jgi:4-amino-4-deoxy-L-arabinose transferase-like glycosyltransferase
MLRPATLLRNEQFATWLTARPRQLAIVICVAWVLIGLVGHDPWKSDEAYTFGAAHHMLQAGDWTAPRIGDTAFLKTPPLVHYGAALTATAFSPFFAMHDAARLSVGIWLTLLLVFTAFTARELWGGNSTWIAPLMLIGCAGLLVRGHQLISAVVLLAALAIGIYGLALAPRRSLAGGAWLGVGLGMAFLASGVSEPLMLIVMTIGMVIISPRYRTARFAQSASIALVVAIPLIAIWPLALYLRHPELFAQWSAQSLQQLGELFVFTEHKRHLYFLDVLPWFAWPAWIFALWSLWVEGKEGLSKREVQLPLVAFLAIFGFLSLAGEGRDVMALPMLLPLALLASIAISRLPRGALNAYYWFGIMVATVFTLVAWVYFSAAQFGVPSRLAEHIFSLQPEYQAVARIWSMLAAIIVTAVWFVLVFNLKRSPERPFILWAAGITIGWALAVSLLFHWIDARRTYRSMVAQLVAQMPGEYECIISQGVGDAQRAMFYYFGNIITSQIYTRSGERACDLLITQDRWDDANTIGAPWQLIWEGGRAGDRHERYRLFRRTED